MRTKTTGTIIAALAIGAFIVIVAVVDGRHHKPAAPQVIVTSATVQVPAGSFIMGCDDARDTHCVADEKPLRTVNLSAFEIDRESVTQASYLECVKNMNCTEPEGGSKYVSEPDQPVAAVTWYQAVNYCAFAGKSLPTEAQWERAAPYLVMAKHEFVRDYYDSRYAEDQPYDPQGPVLGIRRVVRGDDREGSEPYRRWHTRGYAVEGMAFANIGFRCAQ